MTIQPLLETGRLLLRPFSMKDAPQVQRLAGERDVAANVRGIPHPYGDGVAEAWISSHRDKFKHGEVIYAVTLRDGGELIGAISLVIDKEAELAELGFWIGKPHWKQGYCTEASEAMLRYGFGELGLNRIHAFHMSPNVASARVLQKLGMSREGLFRQAMKKWGVFQDIELYAMLKGDYAQRQSPD